MVGLYVPCRLPTSWLKVRFAEGKKKSEKHLEARALLWVPDFQPQNLMHVLGIEPASDHERQTKVVLYFLLLSTFGSASWWVLLLRCLPDTWGRRNNLTNVGCLVSFEINALHQWQFSLPGGTCAPDRCRMQPSRCCLSAGKQHTAGFRENITLSSMSVNPTSSLYLCRAMPRALSDRTIAGEH